MTEAELVAAIVDDPDDDAPRMVYADWLMQRGDPRGELVALQCAQARADANDEPTDDATIARERELRAMHGESWLAPLRSIVDASYVFRRGFVEHAAFFKPADLASLPTTTDEAIAVDRIAELATVAPLLRSITISHALPPITQAWKRLRSIRVVESSLMDLHVKDLVTSTHLEQLRALQLTNSAANTIAAVMMAEATLPLEHFGYHVAPYGAAAEGPPLVQALVTNPALRGLRSLHLARLAIPDVTKLAAFQDLERLALHRCGVSASAVIELASRLPRLQMLELDDADGQLGDASLGALFAAAPALRRLSLHDWNIGDAGALAIARSPHAAALRRLELDHCAIGEGGVHALLASEHLRGLVWWRIVGKQIGPETAALVDARHRLRYVPEVPTQPGVVDLYPQKIQAIVRYRELNASGLADAKSAVERMAEELGKGPGPVRMTTRWCGLT